MHVRIGTSSDQDSTQAIWISGAIMVLSMNPSWRLKMLCVCYANGRMPQQGHIWWILTGMANRWVRWMGCKNIRSGTEKEGA